MKKSVLLLIGGILVTTSLLAEKMYRTDSKVTKAGMHIACQSTLILDLYKRMYVQAKASERIYYEINIGVGKLSMVNGSSEFDFKSSNKEYMFYEGAIRVNNEDLKHSFALAKNGTANQKGYINFGWSEEIYDARGLAIAGNSGTCVAYFDK